MPIYDHLERFRGQQVVEYALNKPVDERVTYRLRAEYRVATFAQLWDSFLAQPGAMRAENLIIGMWDEMGDPNGAVVSRLIAASGKLVNLRGLFLGEVTADECEISWIRQSDVTPILAGFPQLEHLQIRGSDHLSFSKPEHDRLRTLIIESGGLGRTVVQSLGKARFPQLEHLELWLGDRNYGADTTPGDLAPILSGELFPNLTHLGLCNCDMADDVAAALADAPILEKLEALDLSKGNLSDAGCEALLQFPLATRLKKLNIDHHYVSPACLDRLKKAGIQVEAGESAGEYEPDETAEDRMVFCSE